MPIDPEDTRSPSPILNTRINVDEDLRERLLLRWTTRSNTATRHPRIEEILSAGKCGVTYTSRLSGDTK